MVRTDELRGLIAKNGLSQREVARKIGVHEETFYRKMREKKFGSDEMQELIKLLHISNPAEIFFCRRGNLTGDTMARK